MSAYVDNSGHLFADKDDENAMHAIAERIGVLLEHWKNEERLPHYNLDAQQREEALKLGAQPAKFHTLAAKIRQRR